MSRTATVVATGRCLPERLVSNDELRERFARHERPELIDRFEENSGIKQRYWAAPGTTTSDLAATAAKQALERANCQASDLDLIILGTDTPDQITPATSVILQEKLGAKAAGTFDVSCACASFPTALASAAGLIQTNPTLNRVLVVGAYLMHRLADANDPMLFFYGDGAGAAIVEAKTNAPGLCASAFLANGAYANYWGITAGGAREPASHAAVTAGRTQVHLEKRYPPELNELEWPKLMHRLAKQGEFEMADIDLAIFTQVNAQSIQQVCESLAIPSERAPKLMDRYGYTGSACVPIALDHAITSAQVSGGELVTLIGSGVGYNMAGVAFRLPEEMPA
ncbi:MAG: ketoacyl-ACP synthase III [Spiribacter sp.]|jgi:3-oxoacyl-[acyl-carrier-protein] synthase-3|nr:ketoacyl-ACP synthase III [Spiribacter sp.]MDR9489385.1 ketoacyl-ACP synthase III [Spiribacter sp.]